MAARVAVALGSNLGDRQRHLAFAIARLSHVLSDLRVSAIRETEPFGVPDAQPPYINAVAIGCTDLAPHELMLALAAIEDACGRRRPSVRAARTLDLDLILFDDRVIDTPALVVPHPRFREREFVLGPLVELAPDWTDPITGRTARELLRALTSKRPS